MAKKDLKSTSKDNTTPKTKTKADIQTATKRKEAPPAVPDESPTAPASSSAAAEPVLKMSKKMKLMVTDDNQGQALVQLKSSPIPVETPAAKPASKSSQTQQGASNNKLDQLAQLRALSQPATSTAPKIKILAPKAVVKHQHTGTATATKINIIPTGLNPQSELTTPQQTEKATLSTPRQHQPKSNQVTPAIPAQKTQTSDKGSQKKNNNEKQSKGMTTLQESLEKKMQGAQFRVLNEQLYTTTSASAVELMQNQPELFEIYHQGFRTQVEKWPVNPLDVVIKKIRFYIKNIQKAAQDKYNPSKSVPESISVADFGCGDAQLALDLAESVQLLPFNTKSRSFVTTEQQQSSKSNTKNALTTVNTVRATGQNCQIYSFDLVAPDTKCLPLSPAPSNLKSAPKQQQQQQHQTHSVITACDSRSVPIPNQSVDLAVFCLSLMGTNFKDFLIEAHRVLITPPNRSRPSLIIAEVRSRFDEQQKELEGGKGQDVYKNFIKFVEKLGFSCLGMDKSNTMFVIFEFVKLKGGKGEKQANNKNNNEISDPKDVNGHSNKFNDFTLKPCIYKRR